MLRGLEEEGGSSVRPSWVASIGDVRDEESRDGTGNSKFVGLVGVVETPSVPFDMRLRRSRGILLESVLRRSGLSESGLLLG